MCDSKPYCDILPEHGLEHSLERHGVITGGNVCAMAKRLWDRKDLLIKTYYIADILWYGNKAKYFRGISYEESYWGSLVSLH